MMTLSCSDYLRLRTETGRLASVERIGQSRNPDLVKIAKYGLARSEFSDINRNWVKVSDISLGHKCLLNRLIEVF